MKRYPTKFSSASIIHSVYSLYRSGWMLLLVGIPFCGHLMAQEAPVPREAPAPKDTFDREAQFIEYLLDEKLFTYADLAVHEARVTFT
jgi:hypothetical protein